MQASGRCWLLLYSIGRVQSPKRHVVTAHVNVIFPGSLFRDSVPGSHRHPLLCRYPLLCIMKVQTLRVKTRVWDVSYSLQKQLMAH